MAGVAEQRSGNLPAEISSFVGRQQELKEIASLIRRARLVTVTGVGGVGKTRTALRSADELHSEFPDGVWLVELSGLQDSLLLAHTVANALGLQDQTLRPQLDVLADYLAERELLLVLDTCEHLLDACALLTDVLLAAAPGLRILATSRRPLETEAETVFAVAPLPVPENGKADGASYDSMTLFTDRARAVDAAFSLTTAGYGTVAQLCRRLDGIPLAIELAAVWLRTLTAEEIAHRLDHRFKLLAGGDRALARHETLRAAIGWSHELLGPLERLLWARLSAFPGGFDVRSAAEVCGDDRLPADEIARLLEGLVDKSILLRDRCAGTLEEGGRYRLLDTLREYGEEWLVALGEADTMRRLHRDHYLELARRYEAEWCGPSQIDWCNRMKCELPNLRAALDFCLSHPGEHQAGIEMVGRLYLFWVPGGLIREGRHYFERLLALDLPPSPALTKSLWACARLAASQGDFTAVDRHLARCAPYAAEQGDIEAAAAVDYIAGSVAMLRGDHETAVPLLERATALNRDGGDPGTGLIMAHALHAMARVMRGEIEQAVALSEECRQVADSYGEGWGRSFGDYMRSLAEMRRGDARAAVAFGREALRFKSKLNDSFGLALAIDVLAMAAATGGDGVRGARLLGFAQKVWHTFGLPQAGSPDLQRARQACETMARGSIGDDTYRTEFAHGRQLGLPEGISYALGESEG